MATNGGFVHWMSHVRLSRLIGLLLCILITVPLVAHYYISNLPPDEEDPGGGITVDVHRPRNLNQVDELSIGRENDLKARIKELKRIKASVNNELRDLESKRQKLHAEISGYNTHIETLKSSYEATHMELEKLKVSLENTRLEQEELIKRNMPEVQAPHRILAPLQDDYTSPPPHSHQLCHMHNCFDYSRCSLTSQFPVYVYNTEEYSFTSQPLDEFIKHTVTSALDASPYMTYDPHIACLYVVLVGDVQGGLQNATNLQHKLHSLPYWHGDGSNHLLINLARSDNNRDVFSGINTGRALIAQSTFTHTQFRQGFDLVLPPAQGQGQGEVWDGLPPIVPARRKYLLSFQGDFIASPHLKAAFSSPRAQPQVPDAHSSKGMPYNHSALKDGSLAGSRHLQSVIQEPVRSETRDLLQLEHTIVETLKRMQAKFPLNSFLFEFDCGGGGDRGSSGGLNGEWGLCGSQDSRSQVLSHSTFTLIIAPTNYSVISTTLTQIRIHEALKHGAIPVILGTYAELPFTELAPAGKAVIVLPKQRVSELHFVIRSIADVDLLEYRRQGRILWETFLGTTHTVIESVLATLRHRLHIPSFPIREEPAPSVFNATFKPITEQIPDPEPDAEADMLGPLEMPIASLRFRHNFSRVVDPASVPGDPFHLYPYTPFEPVMPGEAKFLGSGIGFRPIGKGAGGAGKEFSEALGGNQPREQFTIVMLTYEREAVLMSALGRLKGLPHLNKVLVVWNNPRPPPDDLVWPDIGVKVHVVKTSKNSLNNRFLPYNAIETEAILSIDDDAHLRHDEIMFGFRVWREARDRIVGFPGRFHAWDLDSESWRYNSNYSCELSMVLTGAAFFHKYYAYLYSYVMPQAIRDKVDQYLNCEDLAMNFLVSHITRKPPIKVTSRWTFRCPGCPKALSVDDSHFQERHKCINFFVQVYGYMPLMYTQYRVDSVLFKTRIPHDKQKCFKFI